MKIELKNIKFSEALSEETNAFTANLYINGKKVGYCKNQGHGGCTDYHADEPEHREIIKEAEEYFKSLPKEYSKEFDFHYQPTLELAIDECLEEWLKAKEKKKMERQMRDKILVGVPDAPSYAYYRLKIDLNKIPKPQLQEVVNRIKGKLKPNEVILNTNLKELGIVV